MIPKIEKIMKVYVFISIFNKGSQFKQTSILFI